MSKRLQVLMPDDDYRALLRAARRRKVPVSTLVRESIHQALRRGQPRSPEEKVDAILRYSGFAGPTGDIEEVLAAIDRGRGC